MCRRELAEGDQSFCALCESTVRRQFTSLFLHRAQCGKAFLRAKEEGDLPACYQHSVQKPASLMVWGCISAYGMGSLHVLEGTMNAERYIKILEQHMLPSR